MTNKDIPISLISRIAAGLLGAFILVSGLAFTWMMFRRGWWLAVAFGLLVAIGGSGAFLQAAYKGVSPPWPDDRQDPGAAPSSKRAAV